jgi:hypothetical protein
VQLGQARGFPIIVRVLRDTNVSKLVRFSRCKRSVRGEKAASPAIESAIDLQLDEVNPINRSQALKAIQLCV